jgi:type I restriction enzyme, S subunit
VMEEQTSIPQNWALIKFGEIIELAYGKGLPKNDRHSAGKYPVYGSNGIVGYHDCFLINGPAIIVGRKGAAGIPTFAKDDCWPIDTTYFVSNSKSYDLRFVYYLLLNLRLERFDRSTAIPGLNRDDAYALDIALPPLNEQKRIVAKIEELFSELDKGIESLKTAREQLKVYRQAVLKHAFEGKLTAHWRENDLDTIKLENFISGNEVKDFPELPKGWLYTQLGEVIEEPKYGTCKKCDYDINGIGVLRIPNIVSGVVDSTDLKFASFDADEINTYRLIRGDILIIRSNGSVSIVGRCALVREQNEKFLYAGYLIRLRPNREFISPEFLTYVLSSHLLRTQIERKAKSTSGVNNINAGELKSLIIPICATEEQEEVVMFLKEKLSIIENLEVTIQSELQKSEALRQSILKKAFSGKLVAQDPNDEPASVLLERIGAEKEAQKTESKKPKAKREAA